MKKSKAVKLIGFLFVMAALALCAFSVNSFYQKMQAEIADWQSTTWFVFSNDLESFDNAEYVTREEIEGYETTTDVYNQGVYFSKLNDNEKLIYKAYQYALDNNYMYTYVDESMLNDGDLSAMDIIVLLSLDSAIVQQNLSTVEYSSNHTIYTRIYGKEVYKEVEGYIVSAETFSEKRIEKVNDAIKELERVDFKFEAGATQAEKAKIIFEYVEDNVDYFTESNDKGGTGKGDVMSVITGAQDYLHSAVFKGVTNCDGFANMYSLLCQMNGITCFEKVSVPVEGEAGHTWNCVNIDGEWYNVDCTESVYEEDEDTAVYEMLQFGFPDSLGYEKTHYASITPACAKNLMPVDGEFSSCNDSGISSKMSGYIRNSDDEIATVVIRSFDKDDFEDVVQNIANSLQADVYYVIDERESCYICCVYKQ